MIDPIPAASPPDAPRPSCLSYGLFVAALAWICGLLALSGPGIWFAAEVQTISGVAAPWWQAPLSTLVQALALAAPLVPLARFTAAPLLRSAYRTWLWACAGMALLGLARGIPAPWAQAALLLQAALALLLAALLWRRSGGSPVVAGGPQPDALAALALGLAGAALAALPWLTSGALGSPLDTLLAALAGAGLGLLAGVLLRRELLPALAARPGSPASDLLFGGVTAGAAALILAAAAGLGPSNLLLMLALPPLGFGALALAGLGGPGGRAWVGPAALLGGAAVAPLALFDPDEVTILLGGADIPALAGQAALWALLAGLLVSLALGAALAGRQALSRRPAALAALGLAAAAAGLAYALGGAPGFYGEKLFVILREQADLSGAPAIAGREERLRFVYQSLAEHADETQAGLRGALDRLGVQYTPYYLVNGLEVDGGPLLRAYLLSRPEVDRVIDSPRLRPLPAPPPPEPGSAPAPDGPAWNIRAIGADRVWEELGVRGAGIVIGQSDSGVDGEHPALRDGYRGADGQHAYNWLDPWYDTEAPRDYGMHGTHTLGSAAGDGGVGVAPDATWFACANLARNLGNPAHYLDCLQFMLAPYAPGGDPFRAGDPARAAHVLNNSWGCPPLEGCDPGSLRPAVAALRAAGIFVVASAGNEGARCESVSDPIAIYDEVFSVGAVDEAGDLADFSSRGPVTVDGSGRAKPDIVAPGDEVLSAAPGGGYEVASGTSMAGPHVAGVVALIWSANPALIGEIERTEQILRETAAPYSGADGPACAGAEPGSNLYGAGVVDAYAAVQAALSER